MIEEPMNLGEQLVTLGHKNVMTHGEAGAEPVAAAPPDIVTADRDAWKRAALLLATSEGNSNARLAIRAAGLAGDTAKAEFAHAWKFCTPPERDLVRLVCGGLGVAVPGEANAAAEAAAV